MRTPFEQCVSEWGEGRYAEVKLGFVAGVVEAAAGVAAAARRRAASPVTARVRVFELQSPCAAAAPAAAEGGAYSSTCARGRERVCV